MPIHAQAQGFNALNELEGVEGAHARTQVAQSFYTASNDERDCAKDLAEIHAVIGWRGHIDLRVFALRPVEFAPIDDDAAVGSAVSAHELRQRMDYDIRAIVDRPADVRRRERVVDDQRNIRAVRDLG